MVRAHLPNVQVSASRHLRMPNLPSWWKIGILTLIIVLTAIVVPMIRSFSGSAQVVEPRQTVQVETTPAQTELEVTTSATPTIPEILLDWTEIPKDTVPLEEFKWLSAEETKNLLNYPKQGGGWGDGTAYLLYDSHSFGPTPRAANPGFYFTPDDGQSWFKVANPYPGESITSPGTYGQSAILEGDNIILYLSLQREPFVPTWWKAEIPLNNLERQSP